MIYLAFTLGLFGSLHCLGMCGPLALGVNRMAEGNQLFRASFYNLGRIVTYALLGVIFGLLGEAFAVAGLQRIFSILAGIVLIGLFLASLDIEQFMKKSTLLKAGLDRIAVMTTNLYRHPWARNPLIFGMANGLLPCGLVYLAVAGSLTSGTVAEGILFMTVFGAGTVPALWVLMVSEDLINNRIRLSFRKLLPYVQLFMGLYLIYRGAMVGMPEELDFYQAIRQPIMCH